MKKAIIATLAALLLAAPAAAAELAKPGAASPTLAPRAVALAPNDLFALHGVLQSIEVKLRVIKDGSSEKQITDNVDLPAGLARDISDDLRAIRAKIEDYQYDVHLIQKRFSTDPERPGYIVKGSPEDAQAAFEMTEHAHVKIAVTLTPLRWDEIVKANPSVGPTAHSMLAPMLADEGDAAAQAQ